MTKVCGIVVVAVAVMAGCGGVGDVQCEEDSNCGLGVGGLCTVAPSGNQWCTYDDATCESGRRWSDLDVGDGLSGECVGGGGDTPDAGVDDIDAQDEVVDAATGADGCTATTCQAEGATCGTIGDGCGLTLNCGICPLSYATKLSAGLGGDEFGSAVSVSNGRVVIGAPEDDTNGAGAGAAYVFERQMSGTWIQVEKLLASDGASTDHFGISVSISGDVIVVGAYWDDDVGGDSGSAHVFERSPQGDWNFVQKLIAPDGAGGDIFGNAVATDGSAVVVAAPLHNVFQGAAYVFEKPAVSWEFVEKLEASDGALGDFFGRSIAASSNRIVVGADLDDDLGPNSGSAYVYDRAMNGDWDEVAKLTASDGAQNDSFGRRVDVSGDTLAVGIDVAGLGKAYIFRRDQNGGWDEEPILVAPDGAIGDGFGGRVAVDADLVVIGARGDDDNGDSSGSAYPFADDMGSWVEMTKLLAPDGAANDDFGTVSAGDGVVVVGAPGAGAEGAAYVFERESP